MAHLAKLKFSNKQRSQVKMTVEECLRHKLIDRLKKQKELADEVRQEIDKRISI